MAKLTLPRLSGGYLDVAKLNNALEMIEGAIENTFSLDGTKPNALLVDLDLNGNGFLNSGVDSTDDNAVLVRSQIEQLVQAYASGYVIQRVESVTASAGQTAIDFATLTYQPNTNNIAIYVDGVRVFGFEETTNTSITLTEPLGQGDVVTAVTNDYLSTVSLPAHTHTWSQVLNKPATATRWPTYEEVTGKPTSFPPASHEHSASAITSGRLADARRGVYVQSAAPGSPVAGDLWVW